MTTSILALLMFAATDPITDEALRLEALRAVFPGMPVVAVAGKRIKVPKVNRETDPDALAGEQIYRVTGQPQDKTEQCAAESVIDLRLASTHEVAIRVYAWPRSSTEFVAILQYAFPGSRSAMSCLSIGMLAHLSRRHDKLAPTEQLVMDTTHHYAITGVQLVDLTGDGIEELVVESNNGGGGAHFSEMHIVDLSRGRIKEVLVENSRVRTWHDDPEEYTLTLDVARSRQRKGTNVCFVKTAFMENGQKFTRPRVSNVCIPTRDNLK
jgi:hypothetical protein